MALIEYAAGGLCDNRLPLLPEGPRLPRFEFEPTGEPDFANGNAAAGRAQLHVDDQPVAQADLPVTVRMAMCRR